MGKIGQARGFLFFRIVNKFFFRKRKKNKKENLNVLATYGHCSCHQTPSLPLLWYRVCWNMAGRPQIAAMQVWNIRADMAHRCCCPRHTPAQHHISLHKEVIEQVHYIIESFYSKILTRTLSQNVSHKENTLRKFILYLQNISFQIYTWYMSQNVTESTSTLALAILDAQLAHVFTYWCSNRY